MADVKVTKATSVASLKRQFKKEFDCTLVVYYGNNQIADDNKKIHEIAKADYEQGVLKLGARSRVGNVASYFKKNFGIDVQIKNADGTKLADNGMTLTQAGKMGAVQIAAEKASNNKNSKANQLTDSTSKKDYSKQIATNDSQERTLNYQLSRVSEKEEEIKKLKNEIQLLKQKSQTVKPKKVAVPKPQPVAKKYTARITATLSYYHMYPFQSVYPGKQTETLDVTITTNELFKKPNQSYFKSYLKLAVEKSKDGYSQSMKLGMDIYHVTGLHSLTPGLMREKRKISGIEFISIEEY